MAYHKIEKLEILNEKAERLQAKKEVEMMKEIEDRVRKEVKNTLNPSLPTNGTQSAKNNNPNIYNQRQSLTSNPQTDLTSPTLTQLDQQTESKRNSMIADDFMKGLSSTMSSGLT